MTGFICREKFEYLPFKHNYELPHKKDVSIKTLWKNHRKLVIIFY